MGSVKVSTQKGRPEKLLGLGLRAGGEDTRPTGEELQPFGGVVALFCTGPVAVKSSSRLPKNRKTGDVETSCDL